MKESGILEWVNTISDGQERKDRLELEKRILTMLRHQGSTPEELAHILAMAIAEYVVKGICGNAYEGEKQ